MRVNPEMEEQLLASGSIPRGRHRDIQRESSPDESPSQKPHRQSLPSDLEVTRLKAKVQELENNLIREKQRSLQNLMPSSFGTHFIILFYVIILFIFYLIFI